MFNCATDTRIRFHGAGQDRRQKFPVENHRKKFFQMQKIAIKKIPVPQKHRYRRAGEGKNYARKIRSY